MSKSLDIDAVRQLVNSWASQGFFRVKGLGDQIHLDDIVPMSSYSLRLRTQYEHRTLGQASVPYHGGPVDEYGQPPSPWDLAVRRPAEFEDRTEQLPVPHTERVTPCGPCAASGQLRCTGCDGWGRVPCSSCNGLGYRERPANQPMGPQPGQPQGAPVRENCMACMSTGRVSCSRCQGRGRLVCSSCQGSGKVKAFEQLTVRFEARTTTAVHDVSALPDALIGRATGDVIVDERNVVVERCPPAPTEVETRANELLQKAQAVNAAETIVLQQHLLVQRVPVNEVIYRYPRQDSPQKKLWIYGAEQRVHAPDAPTNWGRLLVILGIVFLVVAGVGAAILFFTGAL